MTPAELWQRLERYTRRTPSGCWEFVGAHSRDLYGRLTVGKRSRGVHRLVFEAVHGYAPEVVMHRCDNPRCWNPAHLEAGTQVANRMDCVRKGRHARGERSGRAKITQADAEHIRQWYRRGMATQVELAGVFGISARQVRHIWSGANWSNDRQTTVK
jgi:hypothetical protein